MVRNGSQQQERKDGSSNRTMSIHRTNPITMFSFFSMATTFVGRRCPCSVSRTLARTPTPPPAPPPTPTPTAPARFPAQYGAFLRSRDGRCVGSRSNLKAFAQMALSYLGSTADGSLRSCRWEDWIALIYARVSGYLGRHWGEGGWYGVEIATERQEILVTS